MGSIEEAALYTERAHLLALTAMHYPSYITDAPDSDGYYVVTLDTPQGQMAWHIATHDRQLFNHVRIVPTAEASAAYDDHTTDEKYGRVRALIDASTPELYK